MLSFKLSEDFVAGYKEKQPPWGFGINGNNAIGEITFIRTYSRTKPDGTKERWWEVCKRVIEGMYSVQKDHAKSNKLPWNDRKAQASAQEAFDRLWNLKWSPSGRGLWTGGTDLIHERGLVAGGYNCAFVSTSEMNRRDPGAVFEWMMDALMLGIGVGYDNEGAYKHLLITEPVGEPIIYQIPDTREGWAKSVRMLINGWLVSGFKPVEFDYSLIRAAGEPIHGFGGVSSGPAILENLHIKLNELFKARIGTSVDTVLINDIGNLIGACVVAGNIRRSAEIYLGRVDNDDFHELKNAAVFPARNSYDPDEPGWSWLSNNTVVVREGETVNYTKIADAIRNNGEPGILWLNKQQQYGRLVDPPNNKDWRAAGTNPCLVGSTWIQTSDGPQQIVDLIGKQFNAVIHGDQYKTDPAGFFFTGKKQVYELQTRAGHSVKLTADHMLQTTNGWLPADKLVAGDQLILNNHQDLSWGKTDNYGDGYLIGLFVGDGNFSKSNKTATRSRNDVQVGDKTYRASVKVWDFDGDDADIADYAYKYAAQHSHRADWRGWRKQGQYHQMSITAATKQYDINPDSKHDIGHLEYESSEFYKGFLRGLFDADGHVEGYNNDKGLSVILSQSNYELLQVVQRMLLRLGINSSIYESRPAGASLLPDGKGGKSYYNTKAQWRLRIGSSNVSRFATQVGFYHRAKNEKLQRGLTNSNAYNKAFTAKFKSLTPLGVEDVYDVTVPGPAAFDANGLMAHNCSEITLESYELCNLVEVHLNRAEDFDDFQRTLKFAFLFAKTVTLLPTHWPQTNAVIQRNRRIGTSITGTADFYDNNGVHELTRWLDNGYATIAEWDKIYSEWLACRESIKLTTSKPSGTVSLLSGASPGVHWSPGGQYYLRAIRFASSDKMLPVLEAAGYKIEKDVVSANTHVVYFPVESQSRRSEKEVSVFEKASLAALVQRYWADNAVSVTLSFDVANEGRYIEDIIRTYEDSLKTASFLPMGNQTYPQMPYQSITEQEYYEYASTIKVIDWTGIYDNYPDAEGERYCTSDSCLLQ